MIERVAAVDTPGQMAATMRAAADASGPAETATMTNVTVPVIERVAAVDTPGQMAAVAATVPVHAPEKVAAMAAMFDGEGPLAGSENATWLCVMRPVVCVLGTTPDESLTKY